MQTPVVRKKKTAKTTWVFESCEWHVTDIDCSCRFQAQAERIAELEGRLNGLVSTLGVQGAPNKHSSSTNVKPNSISIFPDNPLQSRTPNQTFLPSPASSHNQGLESKQALPEERSPDELLDLFRSNFARQVPFITIPPHVNCITFAQEKPFLYQAIIAVTSYHDSVYQMKLGQEFLKSLTNSVVILGKRRLDMLQGLLVYITWYLLAYLAGLDIEYWHLDYRYNTLFRATSQMNSMLALAFSLVIDLYLYVQSTTLGKHEEFLDEMKGIISCHQACWTRAPPTREEKRTILGCFYIFACVSFQSSITDSYETNSYW